LLLTFGDNGSDALVIELRMVGVWESDVWGFEVWNLNIVNRTLDVSEWTYN
jgi:hypothetical protein